jgi:hypothetical protein
MGSRMRGNDEAFLLGFIAISYHVLSTWAKKKGGAAATLSFIEMSQISRRWR